MATLIVIILLIINSIGFAVVVGSDINNIYPNSPRSILSSVSQNLTKTDDSFDLNNQDIIPNDGSWCVIINESGDIVWSQNKPDDIPEHYSINDVARMTRWYLNDYPVYVSTEDYGLLVLGTPKNAVGKYSIEYSMDWFSTLPQRVIIIIIINLCLAGILAFLFGIRLYKQLKLLTSGIKDLRHEKKVRLRKRGIFKEVYSNINETSDVMIRKNQALSIRDNARSNWIAGISHDIRTPLSMIMGYSESLADSKELSDENRMKANIITSRSIKIKSLIEDLNLISSLEYDMQPSKKKPFKICTLIRGIVSEIINNGLSDIYSISLDLKYEKATILGDEALFSRALFNLINNAIIHNENGCDIRIEEYKNDKNIYIKISDNGCEVNDDVIDNIKEIPKSAHGLGLPMAYKIAKAHGGTLITKNDNGFTAIIEIPSE